jgi:hypothetical protein
VVGRHQRHEAADVVDLRHGHPADLRERGLGQLLGRLLEVVGRQHGRGRQQEARAVEVSPREPEEGRREPGPAHAASARAGRRAL